MHPCTLAAMHHPLPVLKVIFSKKAGLLRCTALHYLLLIYCHKLHPLLTNFTHHIHRSASEQFTRTSSCMRVGEYTSLGSTLFPRVKPMESLERKVWFFSVLPLNNLPVVETVGSIKFYRDNNHPKPKERHKTKKNHQTTSV